MKQAFVLTAVILLLSLSLTSCGTIEPAAAPSPTPSPAPTAPPTLTLEPTPSVTSECDASATQITFDAAHELTMHATEGAYPANCLYYCVQVPEGDRLEIGIYDFNADLDIYVAYGALEAVKGSTPLQDESHWMSNDPGIGDETVFIPHPRPGNYYIEVCSYEGQATPFRIETRFR
ncbi:MAG: PPC domain-containing protein [Anaerolineae bacterium]|nr:PPC domain-containing protein [Anaerolineae bacterium]